MRLWKRMLATAGRPLYPKKLDGERPIAGSEMKDAAKKMLEDIKLEVDSAIAGLDQLCDDASNVVEADWPTRKLSIVPGSAILDEVYKTFGARYDKVRDGIGVAAQMRREEIDVELREFVRKLDSSNHSNS